MTLVNIDLRNQGYETGPDDRVIFYSLLVREGDFGTISTAPVEVQLTDGKASVDLAPGPVGVQIIAGQVADTRVRIGEVPPSGTTTLNAVMMVTPAYTPALQAAMIAAVERAKDIAVGQVDAEVAQAVDAEVGEFKTKAEQALTKSVAAESKSDAALSKSTTAESSAGNAVSRVEALEVMGGLTPGEPADGQTANLIEQEHTLTRSAVDRAADISMGVRDLATYGTKVYEAEATGEVVTLAGAHRADVSIATALPEVALAQVKSLDPDADLTDSADWYSLQSLIGDCATRKVKAIKVPRGTYYVSRGLDLSALEYGTDLDMSGVILRATKEMPRMIWLEHRGNYWKARRINIQGLEIRGRYLAQRGVDIEGVQEWAVDVRVHECYIGVALADTWYGNLSRESVIQDCLTGIAFLQRNTAEVNTIGLDNVKINFAAPKSNFTLTPDADSVGIRISTIMAGIDFHTLVIESVDYGVKYVPTAVGAGFQRGLVMFTGCYWENIKKRTFDFSDLAMAGYTHMLNSVIIRGNRFLSPLADESVFGPGEHEITGNQLHKIKILDPPGSRVTMRIDDAVDLVQFPTSPQIFIDRTPTVPTGVYTERFSPWGTSSSFPRGEAMLYTTEYAGYRTTPPTEKLRGLNAGTLSKLYPTHSITSRPTVYYPSFGDSPNGPVLRGADGWYMILLGEDGVLTTRKVNNLLRLDEGTDSRSAKELHLMTPTASIGSSFRCIDTNTEVTLGIVNGERKWVDTSGRVRIGTMNDLLPVLPSGSNVFDSSTRQSATSWNGAYYLYDWFGERKERVSGPLGSRPASPTPGLVYYDTESESYSRYRSGAWESFIPQS